MYRRRPGRGHHLREVLIALFLFNALIPIGAVMTFLYAMTKAVLAIGVIGTVLCWAVLSTPAKVD